MRLAIVAALSAALPLMVSAAPTWQTVSAEQGKRIEIDRTSIQREDGGKVVATGRVVLDREITDARTGSYRVIEATTRYDCASRNAVTLKRVFKKNENEVVREEDLKGAETPVRSGTLDDKVLREVCRPGKGDAKEVAEKANEAGSQLKQANDNMVKVAKGPVAKPSDSAGHGAPLPRGDDHRIDAHASGLAAPAAGRKSRDSARYKEEVVQHAAIHWSYEGEGGPANWSRIDNKNALCEGGLRQSPIDIRDGIKVDLEPIKFEYKPSYFRIIDNGHTVQVTVGEGSLTLTGKTYELVQFHFHKPSEEKINGRGFDMVAHLVHRADDGQLAVVAVLIEKGPENPFIQTLWNYLPLEKNLEVAPPSAVVDLNTFLPASRNYYTYMGSLTTPPCSEGVLWLVLRQPVQMSPEQIGIFSRLYRNNARPVQPSWGRLIKEGR